MHTMTATCHKSCSSNSNFYSPQLVAGDTVGRTVGEQGYKQKKDKIKLPKKVKKIQKAREVCR